MRTNVYVDGFNLYYGALRGTPYRWLDLAELSRRILRPRHTLSRIRYFTADVRSLPTDRQKHVRQQVYQRALRTLPCLTIHKGRFAHSSRWMNLAAPVPGLPDRVRVQRTEEKGSDVNLATYLVFDAAVRDFQAAIVVSNDTDLVEPVKLVRQKFNRPVIVVNPQQSRSDRMRKAATSYELLDHALLRLCQFPRQLTDASGPFQKPAAWDDPSGCSPNPTVSP